MIQFYPMRCARKLARVLGNFSSILQIITNNNWTLYFMNFAMFRCDAFNCCSHLATTKGPSLRTKSVQKARQTQEQQGSSANICVQAHLELFLITLHDIFYFLSFSKAPQMKYVEHLENVPHNILCKLLLYKLLNDKPCSRHYLLSIFSL